MRRPRIIIATALVTLIAVGFGGIIFTNKCATDARSGPIHHFTASPGETFLTDDRAAAIGREVMNRDGFPESEWQLMTDDRTKAPDGRPDRFLTRYTPNEGTVYFHCWTARASQRFIRIELRDGEITARGTLGK